MRVSRRALVITATLSFACAETSPKVDEPRPLTERVGESCEPTPAECEGSSLYQCIGLTVFEKRCEEGWTCRPEVAGVGACVLGDAPNPACVDSDRPCLTETSVGLCSDGFVTTVVECTTGATCQDGVCRPPPDELTIDCTVPGTSGCWRNHVIQCAPDLPTFHIDCDGYDPAKSCVEKDGDAICADRTEPDARCETLGESRTCSETGDATIRCLDGRISTTPCENGRCTDGACVPDDG